MIDYDKDRPIIFIHIPKTAGTSVLELFKKWFDRGLYLHYYNEALCEMPVRHEIFAKHNIEHSVAVYGHFNRRRKFGVEDYYPEARQFITIMRDPLERLISNYFFIKKFAQGWKKHPEPLDPDLSNYVLANKSVMLNYFPREVTFENYKEIIEEYFIEIGIVENIEVSMARIAIKLKKTFHAEMLGHVNATERDQTIKDDLQNIFIENNQLEYTVFNYIKNKFEGNGRPCTTSETRMDAGFGG